MASIVCKSWSITTDFPFFQRLCKSLTLPQDLGYGPSVRFDIKPSTFWKRHLISKYRIDQIHRNSISNSGHSFGDIYTILECCSCSLYRHHYEMQIEGWRKMTEIFDDHTRICTKSKFIPPEIEHSQFLQHLVGAISSHLNMDHVQIAAKTIGILSINENNRGQFAKLQCIPILLQILNDAAFPNHNSHRQQSMNRRPLMNCALFSLIILSRPIGAVEAQIFDVENPDILSNIQEMKDLESVPTLISIAQHYQDDPLILAKIFWLFVNLSLIDEVKLHIVRSGAMTIICNAMRTYPDDKELQYRSVFSIVNLGICRASKEAMLKEDGAILVLKAITQFQNNINILTMAVHAVRSLCSQFRPIRDAFLSHDAARILTETATKYENICEQLHSLLMHTMDTHQLA